MSTPKDDGRTRHGLIALIALRQANAIKERRDREAAAQPTDETPKPKKRGWFG